MSPVFIGTPVPQERESIGAHNVQRLAKVAQWGRGRIVDVAFAADGRSFVVGSAYGVAIYDMHNVSLPPRWVPFDSPVIYRDLLLSKDGKYIRLDAREKKQIRNLATGFVVSQDAGGIAWQEPGRGLADYGSVSLISPDGIREFESWLTYGVVEGIYTEEVVSREVHDPKSGNVIYTLSDRVPYITISERTDPEGCDLEYFSTCGNALMAVASAPYRAAFSPNGDTLTVLYRSPSLYHSNRFSTLRIYRAADGALIGLFGSLDQPVESFAYSPDSRTVVVAFVSGFVQLWDIRQRESLFTAWHFGPPIDDLSFSRDGNYLLLQRMGTLEVRRVSDGALRGRYESVAFAASPTDSIVAIADAKGSIRIQELDTGRILHHIQAHRDRVFDLAFSLDGLLLASSGQDCKVQIWDVRTGKFLHDFDETVVNAYADFGADFASRIFIWYMEFIPHRDQLVGFGSWGTVVSWDMLTGTTHYVIESPPLEYYQGMMTLKPHFPEYFGIDLANNQFYINNVGYDLDSGEAIGEYQRPEAIPEGCAAVGPVSVDGRLMFTRGYDDLEGQICVLDAQDLHQVQTIQVVPGNVDSYIIVDWLYLSPDGEQLIVNTVDGVIYVFQIVPPSYP